eukprot:Opistho-2@58965
MMCLRKLPLRLGAQRVRLMGTSGPTTDRTERLRRTLLNVPGSDLKKIVKATSLPADSIVLDLEDGVSINLKEVARKTVVEALQNQDFGKAERCVRINGIRSGMAFEDLLVVLRSPRLQGIVIPKVESASDIHTVCELINSVAPEESRQEIRLLAAIETAVGLVNLKEIASAHDRLDALIFASEDLCADMGMVRTPEATELLYARSAICTHAKAFGLQAIDLTCIDYKDDALLRKESKEGFNLGYTGKQAIHPNQLAIINTCFSPSAADVTRARRIIDGFSEAQSKGHGGFSLDGKSIDLPVVKWAEKIVARAKAAGQI